MNAKVPTNLNKSNWLPVYYLNNFWFTGMEEYIVLLKLIIINSYFGQNWTKSDQIIPKMWENTQPSDEATIVLSLMQKKLLIKYR